MKYAPLWVAGAIVMACIVGGIVHDYRETIGPWWAIHKDRVMVGGLQIGLGVGIGSLIFLWAAMIVKKVRLKCLFGHNRKYVAAFENLKSYFDSDKRQQNYHCQHTKYGQHRFSARWVCGRCPAMGEHCVQGNGVWTVMNGVLVPDEKAWANDDRA